MPTSRTRVLIVEDFAQWRHVYRSALEEHVEFEVIGEVSDGLAGVHEAQRLQPDLILLDIGLPTLNGIEAARRIREVSATVKIVFVTENRAVEIVQEALNTGACGYVVKSDVAGGLLPAINAALEGTRFVSATVAGYTFDDPADQPINPTSQTGTIQTSKTQKVAIVRHEVGFYSNDHHFLNHVGHFLAEALKKGNAAIVVATEPHRAGLLLELHARGLDMAAAISEGRYISLDAIEVLSQVMVNGMPDRVRVLERLGDLIVTATETSKVEHSRVVFFGECVQLLWEQGNLDAAIELEKLGNKLTKIHEVDLLCGYFLDKPGVEIEDNFVQQVCAEHSAAHSF